jgi:LDH2 family malate/lactate/ureidoglycolate dehydrogenase
MAKAAARVVPRDSLHRMVTEIFTAAGCSDEHAATVADVLVWANLRGVDSHGVVRVPRYIDLFKSGEAKTRPDIKINRTRPSVVVVDADGAPGPVALQSAMSAAVEAARSSGLAWAAVRGTVHTGAIGYYAELAARQGMVGVGIVAGVPNMAYHGARGAAVATSPLAIAVPSASHGTVLLDMATATIALGKIAQHKIKGLPLPEGAALDAEGLPTVDPEKAVTPLPMGGAKGSGMSLMFELMTSVLVANPIVAPFHAKAPGGRKHRQNAAMLAIDIAAFGDLDAFRATADATVGAVKALPAATPDSEVLLPGERGAGTYEKRLREGIPIPPKTWEALTEAAQAVGATVDA